LRPAQHFDALDVEQRCGHADAAEVDVVDQEADRRIGGTLPLLALAHAANLKKARPRSCAGPMQIRNDAEHVLEMLAGDELQRALVQQCHARWRLEQRLLTQRRSDDDFFEDGFVGRRRARAVEQQSDRKEWIQAHNLLPTPVLTGSGSTGSALSAHCACRHLRPHSGPPLR
jgi:hypothetical protein